MKPYTILILLSATSKWLTLSRHERAQFYEKTILPVFRNTPSLSVKFYDSEYFNATISDFLIVSTTDLDEYKRMIEVLRDSAVYSVPYFTVKDIVVGQENLFQDFDQQLNNPAL
ncbi:MAG: hypothetical protein J0H92_19645 [Sphingobacteriales bacterium]|jgi:hypothetical protein|nr:hypothetical protein [Sphingobacteriales bacterium]OJW33474.1 MAG: hypothetical protein BGO54_09470 [Sphingobacteriales bacterium 46-32]